MKILEQIKRLRREGLDTKRLRPHHLPLRRRSATLDVFSILNIYIETFPDYRSLVFVRTTLPGLNFAFALGTNGWRKDVRFPE